MPSIRENMPPPRRLQAVALQMPDFRNLGIWLRVLLSVNALAVLAVLVRGKPWPELATEFVELAAYIEPITLMTLTMLTAQQFWMPRQPSNRQAGIVLLLSALAALAQVAFYRHLLAPIDVADGLARAGQVVLWAVLVAAGLLLWFDLLARAHAPALAEARLLALTARIRPHFLFNSLNAVLGILRADPRRAERALEELADLFRALMKENRELVSLMDEMALTRQYLDLERLRLEERLQVNWQVDEQAAAALVPPLMLQPLVENAVYHGIEPLAGAGEITIRIARQQDRVVIEIGNPCAISSPNSPQSSPQNSPAHGQAQHAGNHMALENIRERLLLFFDLDASLTVKQLPSSYQVRIEVPFRRSR